MANYKKSGFSKDTSKKYKKLKLRSTTTLLHKEPKRKKIRRKAKKPLLQRAKKLFTSNAKVDKKSRFKIKARPIYAILFGLILLITYFIFFTSFFKVDAILIYEGEIESENTQIRNLIEPIRGRNMLFIDPEIVATNIQNKIENTSGITIEKDYPGTLIVRYERFKRVANIINLIGSAEIPKNFTINQVGVLMEKGSFSEDLPSINIKSSTSFEEGDQVLTQETLNYILESKSYFEEKIGLKITAIRYLDKAREVHLRTERDFDVWLDAQVEFSKQIDKLKNAIPKINPFEDNLDYIDLRIQTAEGQKIIYKIYE